MKRKLLTPWITSFIKRNYSTDRNYSTAIDILPEYVEEIFTERDDIKTETNVKPYSEIPGPRELPIIGNAWRFAPIIGKYKHKQ